MNQKMEITRKLKQAYISQKYLAKKRKIEFLLTFQEWYDIWLQSGKFHLRGRRSNEYCMGRHNDIGPYAVNNVSIITNHENCSFANKDRWKGKLVTEETKIKIKIARKKQINVGYDKTIYICNHCQQQIRSKSNLIQHTRAKHGS
jgi:hypothetical protein